LAGEGGADLASGLKAVPVSLGKPPPFVSYRGSVTKLFLQNKMLQIEAPYSVYPFDFFLDFIKNS
jgi:hypothetical protein